MLPKKGTTHHFLVTLPKVRPCKKFKGAWVSFEAHGVGPAFAAPDAKQKAIDYACGRFGGSAGEVRVYEESGNTVERSIAITVAANIFRSFGD